MLGRRARQSAWRSRAAPARQTPATTASPRPTSSPTDGPAGAGQAAPHRAQARSTARSTRARCRTWHASRTCPAPTTACSCRTTPRSSCATTLSRVPGVGDVVVRGVGAYAMRVWLDPDKLAARKLTTQDVIAALQRQNVQVAAGQVGQPPNPSGPAVPVTVTTLGRLTDPEQFEEIILKSGAGGQIGLPARRGRRRTRRPDLRLVRVAQRLRRRRTSSSTSSPARTPSTWPRASARRWSGSSRRSRRAWSTRIPFDTTKFVDVGDQRGVPDARRGRRSRADRDPGLPPELAGAARPGDHGARSRSSARSRSCRSWASRSTCSRCSA